MYLVISAVTNSWWRVAADAESELTIKIVTTSFGLLSIQLLISLSHKLTGPASSRLQLVWQRCKAPLLSWACAVRRRTPASSCRVTLRSLRRLAKLHVKGGADRTDCQKRYCLLKHPSEKRCREHPVVLCSSMNDCRALGSCCKRR